MTEQPTSAQLPAAPGALDLSALPGGFVWGAATSSFQIEGAADQRGLSIWDTFTREHGRIKDGSDASTACDHVARFLDDVKLLQDLGVDAYRFSISWPRVMPTGRGKLSPKGLEFYDALIDTLLEAGITPWVTLYHWDLPQALQNTGGWSVRSSVGAFADYAVSVHAALGDRVSHWMTLNEPWCSAWLGHASGEHAPGMSDLGQAAAAAHHLLLGHGAALAGMREQAPADHVFGIVLNPGTYRAAEELSTTDAVSVQSAAQLLDGVHTRWWLDALLLGAYPQDTLAALAPHLDNVIADGDLEVIAQPLDFLGVNYYSDQILQPRSRDGAAPVPELPGTESVSLISPVAKPGREMTDIGWPCTPDGLRGILQRISTQYPPVPLYVTENGAAYHDSRSALHAHDDQGRAVEFIPDPGRQAYLRTHLTAVNVAASQGVDVRGYFAWSLLDNFEWAHGYTQRFGLVRVDFDTQERRPRASFADYRDAIAAARAQ